VPVRQRDDFVRGPFSLASRKLARGGGAEIGALRGPYSSRRAARSAARDQSFSDCEPKVDSAPRARFRDAAGGGRRGRPGSGRNPARPSRGRRGVAASVGGGARGVDAAGHEVRSACLRGTGRAHASDQTTRTRCRRRGVDAESSPGVATMFGVEPCALGVMASKPDVETASSPTISRPLNERGGEQVLS